MTTAHHPTPTHVGFSEGHEWILVGILAVVLVVAAGAVAWFAFEPTDTAPSTADSVSGFQYEDEATAGQLASPGVTGMYLGNSEDLAVPLTPTSGFDVDDDTTGGQVQQGTVTSDFVGQSGDPDTDG